MNINLRAGGHGARPDQHPGEDAFEEYAFDRLFDTELAEFEEHLLICEACQETLANIDEHIRVMKSAIAGFTAEQPLKIPMPFRSWGLAWNAAAAAALLFTCMTALSSWRGNSHDVRTIPLEAYRGDVSTVSRAPAKQALQLQIDLNEVRPASGYRVEVVDAHGRRVWFGGTPAILSNGLASGTYWVRLFTDSGELLREFGLRAE